MSKRLSKMGWIVLAALLCLSLMALPACTATPAEEEEEQGTTIPYKNDGAFIEETIGGLNSLDPIWHYDTASGEAIDYMYDRLLAFDGGATDKFVPMLATDWTISPDGKQITFTIRDGVKFWNGDTLTAEDVEYSFERGMVQNRAGGPTWMFYMPLLDTMGSRSGGKVVVTFDQIDKAVEANGNKVTFNFVRPFPSTTFLQILTQTWSSIVDKNWCITNGQWPGTADCGTGNSTAWTKYNNPKKQDSYLYAHAMGAGPWKLDVWEPASYIRLVKSDNYWQGSVPFNTVTIKFVDEWTSRKLSLLAGDADLVYVPRNYIGEVLNVTDLYKPFPLPDLTVDAFFFNQNIGEDSEYIGSGALDGNGIPRDFFADIDVRKGFNYAFDFETYISDAMQGEAKQMGSPVIEGLLYYNPNTPKYSLDLAKATEHLKAAWGGQVWAKGFKFTLTYNTGNIPRKTACEILAENLLSINEKFQISVLPITWNTFLDKIFTPTGISTLPMFQIGWQVDYPDPDNFITPFMHSAGDFAAYTGYGNPTQDAIIEAARIDPNPTTRQATYYALQKAYYDDAPGIMLVQPEGRRFFTKYIHGFYFNPTIPGLPGPLYQMSKSES